MFGTLAGIGGLLLLFHIMAIGYGVGGKKEEEGPRRQERGLPLRGRAGRALAQLALQPEGSALERRPVRLGADGA